MKLKNLQLRAVFKGMAKFIGQLWWEVNYSCKYWLTSKIEQNEEFSKF